MTQKLPFVEAAPDDSAAQRASLLSGPILQLGLKIEGSYLQDIVERLYRELEQAGIKLRPKVYLADEWACPDGVPVIGIPFYLADPRLMQIEDEMMDGVEAQTEQEILSYLRHEAGHTFNYAHKLYERSDWRALFGEMSEPYLEDYKPRPFSRNYVRHIPGWYAQKHPDEDFSETFAVWLTPDSNWRTEYRGWGCYEKLLYVDAIVRERGQCEPVVSGEDYDFAAEALVYSVEEHYRRTRPELDKLPAQFDHELRSIFRPASQPNHPRGSAEVFLMQHRRSIARRVAYWTGLYDVQVRSLVNHLIERAQRLELEFDEREAEHVLVDVVAFATTLCMNRLYRGQFVFDERVQT